MSFSNDKLSVNERIIEKIPKLLPRQSRFDEDFNNILLKKADITLAVKHGIAQRLLKIDYSSEKINQIELCKCCNLPCKLEEGVVEEFDCLNTDIVDLVEHLGIGIQLYFFFIKFVIITLLIMITVSCLIEAYYLIIYHLTNNQICSEKISDYQCQNYKNFSNSILTISVFSLNFTEFLTNEKHLKTKSSIQNDTFNYYTGNLPENDSMPVNFSIINLICVIVLLVSNFIFLILANNLNLLYDIESVSPSDFTLIISNIPKNLKSKSEILKYLKIKGLAPIHINLSYKLGENDKLIEKYEELLEELRENKDRIGLCIKLNLEIDEIVLRIKKLKERREIDELFEFSGVVFATFENISVTDNYLMLFPQNIFSHLLAFIKKILFVDIFQNFYQGETKEYHEKRSILYAEKAREPEDIIWSNLEYSMINKTLRKISIYFISFIMILIGAIIIYFLNKYQRNSQVENIALNLQISVAISIVILIIKSLIKFLLIILTKLEKCNSQTEFSLSHAKKLTLLIFIISGIVPLIINHLNDTLYTSLVTNIFLIVVLNAGLEPILFCIPPYYFYLLYQRFTLKSKFDKKENININQKTANEYFENPEIELNEKFAYIGSTILLTFFYAPLLPIVSVISLFGMIFLLILEKVQFCKF